MIEFGQHVDQIRKEQKSIYNRLKSIQEDSLFIDQVAALYPDLPLAANERCGSWYINPNKHKVHSAYFKSTDGHAGQWDFNVRRGNFHLVDLIAAHQGCILVDSTRRGKRIPDALAKTVPIWCCVLNRAVNPSWHAFYSLPSAVSRSEHAQIEARIDGFVANLKAMGVDLARLQRLLKKPLRPIWLTPQSQLHAVDATDFYPVVCVSASEYIQQQCQARPGYMYVQGSGDDQEAWAKGLTCDVFWQHHGLILQDPSECDETVAKLVQQTRHDPAAVYPIPGTPIVIGNRMAATNGARIQCCVGPTTALNLAIPPGKKGQHVLETAIRQAITYARPVLRDNKTLLVYSDDGKDRAVGIALALLVHYYDHDKVLQLDGVNQVTKHSIRQKLIQIMACHPQAKPSRVTLRRVNTHFLSHHLDPIPSHDPLE